MQRHSKILQTKVNAKAFVTALICVVFLVIGSVISAFAIQPPMPGTADTNVYLSAGNVTQEDYNAICDTIECMLKLGYFQFGDFIIAGRNGSTTRLFVALDTAKITYTSTKITISGTNGSGTHASYYDFTVDGFSFTGTVVSSGTIEIPLAQAICYTDNDGNFVRSSAYTYGTAHSDAVVTRAQDWVSFYNKVWNYDTNLQNATNAGFAQGELVGKVQGREEGYETGYDEGYDEGYDAGLQESEGTITQLQQTITTQATHIGNLENQVEQYESDIIAFNNEVIRLQARIAELESLVGSPSGAYELDIGAIITALPQSARNIIDSAFGFELFGINVASTLSCILLLAIVVFVVKWLMAR